MPDIGRWVVLAPLAENHPNLNPMMYVANNPIRFINANGRGITSTGVRDNKDETYTIANAKNDGKRNISS
ncbi:hypothetical protein SAMN05421769_3057 [Chryseobacterium scophthalmum]|uniref:RHS repeat-associated core domain-containing protein n=1 Tax=Chryseobacterium scophthalmum TaxID=59733 RepID=A0A1N6I0C4_9FLAO|nr:hypothetical protein SAMN05421769_3057 [Chryseobacterium scophthalmum]